MVVFWHLSKRTALIYLQMKLYFCAKCSAALPHKLNHDICSYMVILGYMEKKNKNTLNPNQEITQLKALSICLEFY